MIRTDVKPRVGHSDIPAPQCGWDADGAPMPRGAIVDADARALSADLTATGRVEGLVDRALMQLRHPGALDGAIGAVLGSIDQVAGYTSSGDAP
ncbi:hypothetical protein [Curtobacterium sp. VKM Ac-1393]|uniref:hypothetical protein n=1 Tax=Curtobacterium sp. VKM Ac-1393 TaxID=2783814 RepID=UPI00188B579D|nr:hypothetical protein [Curtobacterium sp. VKM Ac-1393]MBF4607321.1 hypothetical protein [Curtobacterium sp. VKM Ac-1393]